MRLRLHLGPLTGFFAPPLRAEAERQGEPPPTDDDVRERVLAWREWLSEGLERGGHLRRPLSWDEADPEPSEEFDFEADALVALRLWLAYDGHGAPPPELPERPERDPCWHALAAQDFADTAFDQILVPELWLPGHEAFTFPCPYPDGHEVQAGWVGTLAEQLATVHEKKLAATPFEARLAATAPAAGTRELLPLARHAAGVLATMAARAEHRRLPLLLGPA